MILVIDVYNVARAAFHKCPLEMTLPDGRHTNALKGFITWVGAAIGQFHPDEIVLVSEGKKNWRKDLYPGYKADRDAAPVEFPPQLPMIKEFADAVGWTWLEPETGEADDLLAAVVQSRPGAEVLLYTSDKDAKGLVSDRVSMLRRMGDGTGRLEKIGPAELHAKHGFSPSLFPDFLALTGDTTDCVPGVPKIGEGKATKLLIEFGSADQIYARIGEVKGKLQEQLRDGYESFLLSRKLVTLDANHPVPALLPMPGMERMSQLTAVAAKFQLSVNVSKVLARPVRREAQGTFF